MNWTCFSYFFFFFFFKQICNHDFNTVCVFSSNLTLVFQTKLHRLTRRKLKCWAETRHLLLTFPLLPSWFIHVRRIRRRRRLQRSCRDVDQRRRIDPGRVWKCFIIDSGSALHHFVYPTVDDAGADSPRSVPLIYQPLIYTQLFPNHICARTPNENN